QNGQRTGSLVGARKSAYGVFSTSGVANVLDRLSAVAEESFMDAPSVHPLDGCCRLSRLNAVSTFDRFRLCRRVCIAGICPPLFVSHAGVLAGESMRSGLTGFRADMFDLLRQMAA